MKFDIPAHVLYRVLSNVLPFAATDDTRPILSSINFEGTEEEGLIVVATDSYTLGMDVLSPDPCRLDSFCVPAPDVRYLLRQIHTDIAHAVPSRSRRRVQASLNHAPAVGLSLHFHDDQLDVWGPDGFDVVLRRASSQQIGSFPGWRKLFPTTFNTDAFVVTASFLARFITVQGVTGETALCFQRGKNGGGVGPYSKFGPILITEHNGTFRGLLMPWRT